MSVVVRIMAVMLGFLMVPAAGTSVAALTLSSASAPLDVSGFACRGSGSRLALPSGLRKGL